MRLQAHTWPILIGVALVGAANWLEHVTMPVVTDFTVVEMAREADKLRLSGWMRKSRNCQFAGVTAEGLTSTGAVSELPLSFRDAGQDTATRPTGTQSWGPWSVELPVVPDIRSITLTALHRCHPAWVTTTELIKIPVPVRVEVK
jgi:hypothetical protein